MKSSSKLFLFSILILSIFSFFSTLSRSNLIINEVDATMVAPQDMEFVEILNYGTTTVNFATDTYQVIFFNGANDSSYARFNLTSGTIPPNGYLIIGSFNLLSSVIADVERQISDGILQNGPDGIGLYSGAPFLLGSNEGIHLNTGNLIDGIVYGNGTSSISTTLLNILASGDTVQVNEDAFSTTSTQSMQRIPHGSGPLLSGSPFVIIDPTPAAENTAPVAPNPGFYGTPTSGNGPLTVVFTDTSANIPTSWIWTFGDGSTSNAQNPSHTYDPVSISTTYSVQLIVSNAYGTATITQTDYIYVTEPPPDVPNLLSPIDGLTTNNHMPLFSWSTSTGYGNINYTWQIAMDSGFNSIITTVTGIDSTSYTPNSLPNGSLYWHVLSSDEFGTNGYSPTFGLIVYDTTDQREVFASATVTFYLGDSTGFLPVTAIFNTTDSDTVSITLFDEKPLDVLTSYYISRYWLINRVGTSTLDVTLTFSYTTDDVTDSGIADETSLYPAQYSGSWTSISSGISRDTVNHTLTVSGVTDFSRWTLGGENGVPVELSVFRQEEDY